MLVFLTLFVCLQSEDYAEKGYKLMIQASSKLDKNDRYYKNHQGLMIIRSQAFEIAKKNCFDAKAIKKMAKSDDIIQRLAAAYACGMGVLSTIDESLYDLIIDDNNLVSTASREAFVFISNKKLKNFIVDLGPSPLADKIEKHEASVLWKTFMFCHELSYDNFTPEELKASECYFEKKKQGKIHISLKQLEPEKIQEDESNDPTPSDLVDPSAYTVKAITRKSVLQIMNR